MEAKVYLSKRSTTKNFTHFVEFNSCSRHLTVLVKAVSDNLRENINFVLTRALLASLMAGRNTLHFASWSSSGCLNKIIIQVLILVS
jgi:hypothetical protein